MAVKKNAAAGGDKSLDQVEGMVMGAVSVVPVPQFKRWVFAYFHPYEALAKEKANATFGGVAMNAGLAALVVSALFALMLVISSLFYPSAGGIVSAIIAGVAIMIIYPILAVIGTFIMSAFFFVFAKLMGGKGGYMHQALMAVLISGGAMLLNLPLTVIGLIPIVGIITSLISLVVGIYSLFSYIRMIKGVHQLSTMRALAAVFLPIIIIVVLIIAAALVLGAAFLGALGGMAAASAARPY